MEPAHVTFQQLEEITEGFSEARILGQGSYGRVYRGTNKNGKDVAVKLLYANMRPEVDEKQFQDEFENLRRLNHPNIVKLHSYCYETRHKHIQHDGQTIFAENINRALCLEYMQNGSLQKYLSDESDGLDWHTRYDIIMGTSEGLKYLHENFENPIYHLDIKPDNILLDKNMVPKLADFGLSKVFGKEQTLVAQGPIGTPGYLPPEFIEEKILSKMFDVFSLGVVMIKIITGPSGRTNSAEMHRGDYIDLVCRNWKKRLHATWSGSALEAYCQQVERCTEIALSCMETDRHKRPNITAITHELSEMISCNTGTGSGHPLELRSPLRCFMPCNSMVSCPLELTNSTDDYVAFMIHKKNPADRFTGPLWGVVPPRSMYTRVMTRNKPAESMYQLCFTLESSKMEGDDIRELFNRDSKEYAEEDCLSVFKRAKEKGREVHQVKLMSLYKEPGAAGEPMEHGVKIQPNLRPVHFLDMHYKEPWILANRERNLHRGRTYNTLFEEQEETESKLYIWNYETQEVDHIEVCGRFGSTARVTAAKFLPLPMLVVGDSHGQIHMFQTDVQPVKFMRRFDVSTSCAAYTRGAVTCLTFHATTPTVLIIALSDGSILLWDFAKSQESVQIIRSRDSIKVEHVVFHPNDNRTFASATSEGTLEVWNLNTAERILKLTGHSDKVTCMDYFSNGDEHYLITCSGQHGGRTAEIWDFHSGSFFLTLEGHTSHVDVVCAHPDLSILLTGSSDGTVRVWNSTTFRLESTLNFGLGRVLAIGCVEDSRRIAIGCQDGLVFTDIDPEETVRSIGFEQKLERKEKRVAEWERKFQ